MLRLYSIMAIAVYFQTAAFHYRSCADDGFLRSAAVGAVTGAIWPVPLVIIIAERQNGIDDDTKGPLRFGGCWVERPAK